jgi:hypothetical protein
MFHVYSAKLYRGKNTLIQTSSDSIAELYIWMLTNTDKVSSKYDPGIRGEIVDNHSHEVVQTFEDILDK